MDKSGSALTIHSSTIIGQKSRLSFTAEKSYILIMRPFPSPLRYPGGKTFLASEFERIIEAVGLNKPTYIEPYAGGAGAALALLFSDKVKEIVINDLDPAIFAFWKAATEQSEKFAQKILSTPVTVSQWYKEKEVYKNQTGSLLERGFATFFLNRTNRSGVMNAWPIGGIEQSGNYLIDARYNKKNLAERILKIGTYVNRITVCNDDGIKLTERYLKQNNTFIYLDPPYFKKGAMLYLNHYETPDHSNLSKLLNENSAKHWILTYDQIKNISNLYPTRDKKRIDLKYRVRGSRVARELVIYSDPISLVR